MTLQDVYQWAEGVREDAENQTHKQPNDEEKVVAALLLMIRSEKDEFIREFKTTYENESEFWEELREELDDNTDE